MNGDALLALIRGCKETPDDDAPRLVLADWLEEHGDPERAEFIRLQCAPLCDAVGRLVAGWRERQRCEQELLERNRTRWLGRLEPGVTPPGFYRGLVCLGRGCERLPTDLSDAETAWVEALRLRSEAFTWHCRLPPSHAAYWRDLVAIHLAGDSATDGLGVVHAALGSDTLQALLAIPALPALRNLSLCEHEFTEADMARLAAAPLLGRLTHLTLSAGPALSGLALCRELAGREAPTQLSFLTISAHLIDDQAMAVLCQAPCLNGLRDLYLLSNGRITDESLRALAGSALLGRLRCLDLSACRGVTDGGVAALAAAPAFRSLAVLRLGVGGNYAAITDKGVAALASSPHAAGLRELRLWSRGITDRGAMALAGSACLGDLQWLDLCDSAVGESGAMALTASAGLRHLRRVNLQNGPLEREMVRRGGAEEANKQRRDPRWNGRVRVEF